MIKLFNLIAAVACYIGAVLVVGQIEWFLFMILGTLFTISSKLDK